jgi:RNA polymerase sigma-70 factor (ECF subfamily)
VVEGRPPQESALVERAREGDEVAYQSLVRLHQGIAFRTAYLITGSAADAEDAAQVGFVKAWQALGRFRRGAPFRPWVLQIVANEARNRRRSASRREALALRAIHEVSSGGAAQSPGATQPPGATPSPEAMTIAADERERLLAAVNTLRDEDREILGCRYFLELSEEETASTLGLRRGTVKSRTSRALARLREVFDA